MKKIYIAKRIPKNPNPKFVLEIEKSMGTKDIYNIYTQKTEICENYIYNGPWILRPPTSNDTFSMNNMPDKLSPKNIWEMVKVKIESSDVYLGIVNSKSYGTIAETGYACKCPNVAVYVLPEFGLSEEELQDLWFVFQMASVTEHLWNNEDIKMMDEFSKFNINSIDEYKSYLSKIIPNFMKK